MTKASPPDVAIRSATDALPDDLAGLASEASAAGMRHVDTLIERWVGGTERYDAAGEALLLAWSEGHAVGVGGIARCPDVPGALRVRRFYVGATVRRRGVARQLAQRLIASGFEHTDILTCNARASSAAPPFWEAMGFEPVDVAGITHRLQRRISGTGSGTSDLS